MTIAYYGSFPCKVREAVSDSDLLRMESARGRANAALEVMRRDPANKSKPESEWSFKLVIRRPEGPEITEQRIQDLLLEAAPLDQLAVHCAKCPANIRAADFGCGGDIHYPLSEQAERWLLARLPADLSSGVGLLLKQAIADHGYDGAVIEASRHRKDLYEARIALHREWDDPAKTRITSSQILHMTFALGNLPPTHARLIAYYLGFINDRGFPADSPENLPQPKDDRCIVELKYFFLTAALAGAGDVPMMIDA